MTSPFEAPQQAKASEERQIATSQRGVFVAPPSRNTFQGTMGIIPLYRGFDGLDVSFQGQISEQFESELKSAKEEAQRSHRECCLDFAGIKMLVAESGARGGYAYRASTGKTGATWFFKKPNNRDPWGVRVSCSSFMLADLGLGKTQARLYDAMNRLGIKLLPRAESIGRVDYAVDFLAPDFTLRPANFVMHSNANRADHIVADDMAANGKSGRVTSVTVGKMPGRQIIVYDKRAEVIAKHKWAWFEIWNARLRMIGAPTLTIADYKTSRVWRIEIRAGKKHLKDRWNIRTWKDFHNRFGDMMVAAAGDIRYAEPSNDSNRSRWQDHQLWTALRNEIENDLFELRNYAPPNTIKIIHKEAHLHLLLKQCIGLSITRAAISGVSIDQLKTFIDEEKEKIQADLSNNQSRYASKLAESSCRYEAQS